MKDEGVHDTIKLGRVSDPLMVARRFNAGLLSEPGLASR